MTQILQSSNTSHQITLGGISIRRDPFGRYSLNDLHRAAMEAGNANEGQRPSQFLRSESVQAFIAELDSSAQICADVPNQQLRGAVFSKAGPESNGGGTWAHELVAIRYAAWIDPAFEVRVYQAFRESVAKPAHPALPHDYISALEHLLVSEKGRLQAVAERDEAIRTKAMIGSKREATAMATASKAKAESQKLKAELGFCAHHATIKAVQQATGTEHAWQPMREWCAENNVPPKSVPDPLYGKVRAWPAQAWRACHSVDLFVLFGEVAA